MRQIEVIIDIRNKKKIKKHPLDLETEYLETNSKSIPKIHSFHKSNCLTNQK